MARLKNKLILKGKADGLIYYEYRGVPCVRSMPREVKPPSAPGQIAQQERIAAVAIFYQALKEVGIYAYWKKAAEGRVQTGYNLLMQANLQAFDGTGCICDFSKLRLTPDMLPFPDRFSLREEETGEWVAKWDTSVHHPGAGGDDLLAVALMKGNENEFDIQLPEVGTFRRRDGEARFQLPDNITNYERKLFLFFKKESDYKCSKSVLFNF